VHPDPDNAAVDPLQPINYADFHKLMGNMDAVAKASYERYTLG
jgi:3-deoxy-7-phosphoheptulonate synthase